MTSEVLYVPHGGGPLPLMAGSNQQILAHFLRGLGNRLQKPDAIVVLSAHWEANPVQITSAVSPRLYFDYYNFPAETYEYRYACPGHPALAQQIHQQLQLQGIDSSLNDERGLDHGVFVPLILMYPEADIPVIQLSLHPDLDAYFHLQLGKTLAALEFDILLWLGSGYSFHNMGALMSKADDLPDELNIAFEDWLTETLADEDISQQQRLQRLAAWKQAPGALYCHPREEHLLPLHICAGLGGGAAANWFDDRVGGFRTTAWYWQK